jgi:hypothetical protein
MTTFKITVFTDDEKKAAELVGWALWGLEISYKLEMLPTEEAVTTCSCDGELQRLTRCQKCRTIEAVE